MENVDFAKKGQGQGKEKFITSYRWKAPNGNVVRGNALISDEPVERLIEVNAGFPDNPVELLWYKELPTNVGKDLEEFQTTVPE